MSTEDRKKKQTKYFSELKREYLLTSWNIRKKKQIKNKYIDSISQWSINQIHMPISEQGLAILTQSTCKKNFKSLKEQATQLTVIHCTLTRKWKFLSLLTLKGARGTENYVNIKKHTQTVCLHMRLLITLGRK